LGTLAVVAFLLCDCVRYVLVWLGDGPWRRRLSIIFLKLRTSLAIVKLILVEALKKKKARGRN